MLGTSSVNMTVMTPPFPFSQPLIPLRPLLYSSFSLQALFTPPFPFLVPGCHHIYIFFPFHFPFCSFFVFSLPLTPHPLSVLPGPSHCSEDAAHTYTIALSCTHWDLSTAWMPSAKWARAGGSSGKSYLISHSVELGALPPDTWVGATVMQSYLAGDKCCSPVVHLSCRWPMTNK